MSKHDVNVQKLFDSASAPGDLSPEISDKTGPEASEGTPIATLPYPETQCLRGLCEYCGSTTCITERREVRELQWIDCHQRATEEIQDGTHSKNSLWTNWNVMESSNIVSCLFGILVLLLAIGFSLYFTDLVHMDMLG